MSNYRVPKLVISIDGEASTLAGSVFAIGAAVIEAGSGRVVDRFMARLTKQKILSTNPSTFTKENVIGPVMNRWSDIALIEGSDVHLHASFFAWWRCWTAGVTWAGVDRVIKVHEKAMGLDFLWVTNIKRALSVAMAYEGLVKEEEIITVADWGFPVEHNIFLRSITLDPAFEMLGPAPMHEISTLRLAASLAAPSVAPIAQRYASFGGLEHNPLDDAIVSGMEAVDLLRILLDANKGKS
jgi:hypothetical protein